MPFGHEGAIAALLSTLVAKMATTGLSVSIVGLFRWE